MNNKTTPELLEAIRKIEEDPANRAEPGCLFMYTKKACKKLDKLRRDIVANQIEAKKAAGTYTEPDGYSGLKQKKRR